MDRLQRLETSLENGLASYERILAYVQPYWQRLAVGAGCLLLVSLLTLAIPWTARALVDLVIVEQDLAQLNRIVLTLVGILLLRATLGYISAYQVSWAGEQVAADLLRRVYERLLSASPGSYLGEDGGGTASQLSDHVRTIRNAVTTNLEVLLQETITVIAILAIVAAMSGRLLLLMLVCPSWGATINNSPNGSRAKAAAARPGEWMPSSLVSRINGFMIDKPPITPGEDQVYPQI